MLEAAKGRLLEAIPRMSPEKLTQLLELSFAYVGLPQLRDIPLAVLGQLQPVPAAFLKQLATDQDLFQDLPLNVQQEVSSCCAGSQADSVRVAAPSCRKARGDSAFLECWIAHLHTMGTLLHVRWTWASSCQGFWAFPPSLQPPL